jgi:hypothetical protein
VREIILAFCSVRRPLPVGHCRSNLGRMRVLLFPLAPLSAEQVNAVSDLDGGDGPQ